MVKNLPAGAGDAGDMGSIPGAGRFPGGGNGSPLQYSCLGKPMGSQRVKHDQAHTHYHYLHTYISFFFRLFSQIGYYRVFSSVLCTI